MSVQAKVKSFLNYVTGSAGGWPSLSNAAIVGQCFNTNTKNKLAACGTPSFPEGNVMHENFSVASSELYRSCGDSTLHSVSVVAVVIERQG